jgi:beta-mannosidase
MRQENNSSSFCQLLGCTVPPDQSFQLVSFVNDNRIVWHFDAGKMIAGPDRYLTVHSAKSLFPANRHFFSPIKELQHTPVQPERTITQIGEHELHVHLRAMNYAYFVHLIVPDERTHFTDNYFDLEAGEMRTIILTNRSITLTPEMVSVGWR